MPDPDHYPEEVWGIEDPRITWLPEREEWAIAYTAFSRRGPLVSLAVTRDFRHFHRLGPAMPPEDKDAALFPRRIDGRWALIHRPTPLAGPAHIWLAFSPDLRHWGDHTLPPAPRAKARGGTPKDRAGTATPRDARGMADALPRCPFDGERLALSGGTRAPGPRGSAPGPPPHGTSGCSGRRNPTSRPGTSGGSCSRAAGSTTRSRMSSGSTTARPTRRSRSQRRPSRTSLHTSDPARDPSNGG